MPNLPDFDPYKELEVDRAASPETIEAAWRSLAKRHHPDTAADKISAARRLVRLNQAHDLLADPVARAAYDGSVRNNRPASTRPGAARAAPQQAPRPPPHPASWTSPRPRTRPTYTPGAASPVRRSATKLVLVLVVLLLGFVLIPPLVGRPAVTPIPSAPAVAISTALPQRATSAATTIPRTSGGPSAEPASLSLPRRQDVPPQCDANGSLKLDLNAGPPEETVFAVPCMDSLLGLPAQTTDLIPYSFVDGEWTQAPPQVSVKLGQPLWIFEMATSPGQFGVSFTAGDGAETSLAIYQWDAKIGRIAVVWDSATAHTTWSMATFTAGIRDGYPVIVVHTADLNTGTCMACGDHKMYDEAYRWKGNVLSLIERVSAGIGP